MKNLQNFHVLEIKFVSTANGASKVRISSDRFGDSVLIPWDYQFANSFEIAQTYLEKTGFELIGKGETKIGYAIISTTFKKLKL
jgi:hypothetical protein